MSRAPKSDYKPGQTVTFQPKLTIPEHEEFKRQAKEAGLGLQAYFLALLDKRKGMAVPMLREPDPIRPENREIHKRFELIWNALNEAERLALEGVLDRFSPNLKGKRAS